MTVLNANFSLSDHLTNAKLTGNYTAQIGVTCRTKATVARITKTFSCPKYHKTVKFTVTPGTHTHVVLVQMIFVPKSEL